MFSASPVADRNLTVTGYIGPAQPVVVRHVAARLGRTLVNVERRIEDIAGMSVDDLRATFGEARLKTIQSEVMEEVYLHRGAVISISGQTLLVSEHYRRLAETGPVVCLVANLDTVLHRLHVALGARYHNPAERSLVLGHVKREWAVRKIEGIAQLDTTYLDENAIVDSIVALWQAQAIQRL